MRGATELVGTMAVVTQRQTVNVTEVADQLGISPASVYRAIERGEIPALRVGSRIVVLKTTVEAMLQAAVPTEKAAS